MKLIDERATAALLAELDKEINIKCLELQEKRKEEKLKTMFFTSCLFVFISFIFQIVFKIFSLNFILIIFLFLVSALVFMIPVILNINKGVITK